jgi:GT2 family glycosyltransferase
MTTCFSKPRLRENLRNYAEREFDVQRSAKQVIEIFERILDEHGSVNHVPKVCLDDGVRMTQSVDETCELLKVRFASGRPTAYVRFGDGELLFMADKLQEGGSHHNSPELKQELIQAFTFNDPDYLIASAAGLVNEGRMRSDLLARHSYALEYRDIVTQLRPKQTLLNNVALAYKLIFNPQWFVDFVKSITEGKTVVFVGGGRLDVPLVRKVFNVSGFIPLDDEDAYNTLDQSWGNPLKDPSRMAAIEQVVTNGVNLIVCAGGMTAKVIAYRLWSKGMKVNFLDIGAIADCLAGIESRSWIKSVGKSVVESVSRTFFGRRTDIVSVTFHNEEATIACFNSVASNTKDYRIIWTDNGSGSASVEKVCASIPPCCQYPLLRNNSNEGYTKAANRGLRKALFDKECEFILILNNDVIVPPHWLERLIETLDASGFGFVSPLTSKNNPHAVEHFKQVLPDLPPLEGMDTTQTSDLLWEKYKTRVLEADNMISMFCCLFKREIVEQIGLMDEHLFIFGEDNDLCMRAKLLGIRFGVALGCYVFHAHRSTANLMGPGWAEAESAKSVEYLHRKWGRGSKE